ncbi:hypothetical protein TNCT_355441, partial [Trichonephila clavata]
ERIKAILGIRKFRL